MLTSCLKCKKKKKSRKNKNAKMIKTKNGRLALSSKYAVKKIKIYERTRAK